MLKRLRVRGRRGDALILGVAVLVYLLIRAWLLAGWWQRIDVEEMEFGLLPAHLGDGLLFGLFDYQTKWREGGSVIMGFLLAPLFALLGPSYFALKAGSVLFYAAVLLVWWDVARRGFGRRAAALLAMALALGPPALCQMQFYGLAAHGEGLLFSGAGLLGLLWAVERSHAGRPVPHGSIFLVGFACSLGVAFAYSVLPASVLTLALVVRNRSLLAAGRARSLALGIGLGGVPWLGYALGRVDLGRRLEQAGDAGVLGVLLGAPSGHNIWSPANLVDRMVSTLQDHLFWMWTWRTPDGPTQQVEDRWLGAGILLAVVLAGVIHRRAATSFLRSAGSAAAGPRSVLVGWLGVFVVGYCSSAVIAGFSFGPATYDGYRYLLPIFLPLLLAAAAGLSGLAASSSRALRAVAGVWAATLALGFAVETLDSLEGRVVPTPLLRVRAYHLENLERRLWALDRQDLARLAHRRPKDRVELLLAAGVARAAAGLEPTCTREPCWPLREGYGRGLVTFVAQGQAELGQLETTLRTLRDAGDHIGVRDVLRGAGSGIPVGHDPDAHLTPLRFAIEEHLRGPGEVLWLHEGIGIGEVSRRNFRYRHLFGGDAVPHHAAWARGIGMGMARLLLDPDDRRPLPAPITVAHQIEALDIGPPAYDEGFRREARRVGEMASFD